MGEGVLRREEALALILRAQQGDDASKEKLVEHNLALVKSIVRRFLGRGAEYEDLFQIGCIGLVKAIDHYDHSYNVAFSTYAVPMISGEIKRFLRDDGMIKVSRSLKELLQKSMAAREAMERELGRAPTVEELSQHLGVSEEDLMMAMESTRSHVSLHQRVYDEDEDSPMIIDRMQTSPAGRWVDVIWLGEMLGTLDEREQLIIRMRYFQGKTQSEIAECIGVSQVQVSRMEKRILTKLRNLQEE